MMVFLISERRTIMNNTDSSGDFELLLLAEKQAAISKKIGEPTNE